MELIIFQMKPRFQKLVNSGLSIHWIQYGRSMLVLENSGLSIRWIKYGRSMLVFAAL